MFDETPKSRLRRREEKQREWRLWTFSERLRTFRKLAEASIDC